MIEGRKRDAGRADLDLFLHEAEVEVVPVTLEQAELACQAFRRFGKGRHPAGLNLDDVFAYALAKTTGEPLLFKGDDFARSPALPDPPGPSTPFLGLVAICPLASEPKRHLAAVLLAAVRLENHRRGAEDAEPKA